jgi:hypothetical protein
MKIHIIIYALLGFTDQKVHKLYMGYILKIIKNKQITPLSNLYEDTQREISQIKVGHVIRKVKKVCRI